MNTILRLAIFALLAVYVAPVGIARQDEEVPDGLSAGDWSDIREAYEAGRHAVQPVEGGHRADNPGQQWHTVFDGRGFTTEPDAGGWTWGLELQRYGFAGHEQEVESPMSVSAEGSRVAYDWDETLQEWYVNDGRGLEHGYTVHERPQQGAAGPLTFTLAVRGGLLPEESDDERDVSFVDPSGETALIYAGLTVFDADGDTLPARFESVPAGLRLSVDERSATYPLTIDPIAQQAYLKAPNTEAGDRFGSSVAISGDIVVIGTPLEDSNATGVNGDPSDNSATFSGAAYVFVRSGASWSLEAYLKASNTEAADRFGAVVSLSGDTVVVGAEREASNATGVGGDQNDNSAPDSGAVYVFVRSGASWSQQAYLKASNTEAGDSFGSSVSISGDTLVVGASAEDSMATGVGGDQADNTYLRSGAAYVFVRTGTNWSQQAYLKASNTEGLDRFGVSVSLSGDTVVVGAGFEDSNATGVNGDQSDNSASASGAAYVFVRSGTSWSQEAYLKASNAEIGDFFTRSVSVSGNTIVIGAHGEDSGATGIDGDQSDNSASASGAAYVFIRSGTSWSQEAYLKASNTDAGDIFGTHVSVSGDTLVVAAQNEDSNATGVNGDQSDNSASSSGAAYVFVRSGASWFQQDYLKASNNGVGDAFGFSASVSGDTVVVGAAGEDSSAITVNGDQSDENAMDSGATYVFAVPQTRNIRHFTGAVQAGGARGPFYAASQAGAGTGRLEPSLDVLPGLDDSATLHVTGHGGATAVLWIGTHRIHDGERWLVAPNVSKRMLVLDARGWLDVPLERLSHVTGSVCLFAQVVVLDPEADRGAALSPVVELTGLF